MFKHVLVALAATALIGTAAPAATATTATDPEVTNRPAMTQAETTARVKALDADAETHNTKVDRQLRLRVLSHKVVGHARMKHYYCRIMQDRLAVSFKHHDSRDYARGHVYYKACTPYDPYEYTSFVVPTTTINSYNMAGTYTDCAGFFHIEGFVFNWYFWVPQTGRNFNPGEIEVKCSEEGLNSREQHYSKVPRLHWGMQNGDDAQARMKMTVEREKKHDQNLFASTWQKFRLR